MRKTAVISLLLLGGCIVGPRYETPVTEFAPQFTENEETVGPEVDLRTWWMQFNDPILDSMIAEAIEDNLDLQIAGERIAQVRARYQLSSANLWPEIDVVGSVSRYRNTQSLCPPESICPPVQNFFQLGFDASWELDFFGRLRSLQSAALFELQASQENFRNVYITLLAEVSRNYSFFRSLQQRIELTIDQIQINIDRLQMAEVRYRAGLRSDIEPLQVQAELEALQATLPPLEAQKNATLYNIAVLLGRQPEEIPEEWCAPQPIPQAKGKIPLGLPSDLLRRRPDIREAERLLAAATSQVSATIALLFPSFSLTGTFGYEANTTNNWFTFKSETWSVGPGVFWPFIDFGRIRDQIDYTKAVQREALLNYEKIVLEALQDVESALVAYSEEQIRLDRLGAQIDSLRESRDLTAALFKAGLRSLTELLDAEQQVLLATQTFISSEQALSEALIAVYKSLGGDWPCYATP